MLKKVEHTLRPMIVYTDLDGTLLDHHNYQYTQALPAIRRLQQLDIPLVPVTSKTLSEVLVLCKELSLQHPLVLEDGCLIAVPEGTLTGVYSECVQNGYYLFKDDNSYENIVSHLRELRRRHGFNFTGFSDLSVRELVELSGLSGQQAEMAMSRYCSEPLLWHGSEPELRVFKSELAKSGYHMSKGGRFMLVKKGNANKGIAVKRLNEMYAQAGCRDFITLGLGDSPNDIPMLEQVDVAGLIRRGDGSCLTIEEPLIESNSDRRLICSCETGPRGWNYIVQQCLDARIGEVRVSLD